jgi:MYXO-CTERM domain-containing protein
MTDQEWEWDFLEVVKGESTESSPRCSSEAGPGAPAKENSSAGGALGAFGALVRRRR